MKLCHILSFLPAEDVFATSVLSKRWILLCLSVPTLDVDDQHFVSSGKSYSNFMMMVCATLFAQMVPRYIEKKIGLRKVRISFYGGVEPSLFEKSLAVVAERGMEHLDLLLVLPHSPCYILSFKNLVVLKLKEISFHEFPISVDLASLKILHLFRIYFKEQWHLAELLNGCPILEEFEVKNLSFCKLGIHKDKAKFNKSTNLVRANINNMSPFYYIPPLPALCNVQFLRLEEVRIMCCFLALKIL